MPAKRVIFVFLLIIGSVNPAFAQVPRPITPRQPQLPTPEIPIEREPPQLEIPPSEAIPVPDINIPGKILVSGFEFVGNTAFSTEELQEVVAEFQGKELSFAELLAAEAAVTKKYIDAGYINSGAIIPAGQNFNPEGAVVKIEIVEGAIADIQVKVNGRLNPDYIRNRLEIATKKPFNTNRLLETLQMLQLNPIIENISAELSTGVEPELSNLTVDVEVANTFALTAFMNNGRNPSVGSFQRGARLNEGNLLGFGDNFYLSYGNTDGSNAVDGSYTVPVNPRNGTLKIAGGFNDTRVIEPPFDVLDITGDYRYFEITFRQPLWETPTKEFALGLTASRQASDTELLGEPFALSRGANEEGEIRLSVIRFFQDFTQRSTKYVFAFRSQFSLGVDAFDATVNNDGEPDSNFFSWQFQGQYVYLFAPDTLMLVRSNLQLSTEPLVGIEQFSVGGLGTVRGYRQDLILSDNALTFSVEARLPILRAEKIDSVLQLAPFIDFGVGWNTDDFPVFEPNTIVGAGVGIQWQMSDRLFARFDWGIPLMDVDIEKNSWNDHGLYFTIEATF